MIALGDFYIAILRFSALWSLPGDAGASNLPLNQLMGVLWVVTVAVYGSVIFDLHGISPIARPFHGASARVRAWLLRLAWLGAIGSLFAGGMLWWWGDLALTGKSGGSLAQMFATVFTVAFAILLLGALVLASWSVVPAITALWFLFLSALRIVVWLLTLICSLLVRLVEALAFVIVAIVDVPARLGLMLHNYLATFAWAERLHWQPRASFAALAPIAAEVSQSVLGSGDDGFAAATGTSALFLSPRSPVLLPAPRPAPRSDSRTTITVLSLGAAGAALMASVWPALKAQLPLRAMLAIGAFDESATEPHQSYDASGVLDVSPTAAEIASAQREALSLADFRQRLLGAMIQRVRQALIDVEAMEGQVIILAGPEALDERTRALLAGLKRRRREQEIIVVTGNRWLDPASPRLDEAYQHLTRMHAAGVVTAALLLDTTHKEDARLAGIAIVSLIGARIYDLDNPSLIGVAKRLAANGPFIQLRVGAADVDATLPAEGPIFARRKPLVSLQDAVAQAQHVTLPLLRGPQSGVVVYTVPLQPREALWSRFCDAMRSWLEERSRATGGAAVMPVFMPGRAFEIYAATLYPMAEVRALETRVPTLAELAPYVAGANDASDDDEKPTAVAAAVSRNGNGAHPAPGVPPRAAASGSD